MKNDRPTNIYLYNSILQEIKSPNTVAEFPCSKFFLLPIDHNCIDRKFIFLVIYRMKNFDRFMSVLPLVIKDIDAK